MSVVGGLQEFRSVLVSEANDLSLHKVFLLRKIASKAHWLGMTPYYTFERILYANKIFLLS